jgi:ornithine cyclodeaminase
VTGGELLLLREPEIRDLFEDRTGLAAIEAAFAAYSTGRAELPRVIQLDVPEEHGEIHIKAGHMHGAPHWAVKVASGFPGNAARGLPVNGGIVLAFDAHTGAPAAILLDNGWITDRRTGLAGAVAAKHLARADATVAAMLGTGGQARHQMHCLALVRRLRDIRVWGRDPAKAAACAADLRRDKVLGGVSVRAERDAASAVAGADIVVTATASREPILRDAWVREGMHVTAVGSDQADKQEVEAALVARADVLVADSRPQCLALGEIHHAVASGLLRADDIDAELGEIVAGSHPGRRDARQITLCDLTGLGAQDVAAANVILAGQRLRKETS